MYKIAYVEDEKDLSNLVVKYLHSEGFDVTHFTTGEEAFMHINEAYDLWILDIMLPGGLNGYEIIKKISSAGTTILLVEQNAYKALSIANRAYILETGEITKDGKASDLITDKAVISAYLGG